MRVVDRKSIRLRMFSIEKNEVEVTNFNGIDTNVDHVIVPISIP